MQSVQSIRPATSPARRHFLQQCATGAAGIALGALGMLAGPATANPAVIRPREMLLLIEKSAHTFSIYDAVTGDPIKHIPMPSGAQYPHEFVVDSRRRYAYIGHYGVQNSSIEGQGGNRIFVIDLEQMAHVRTLRTDTFYRIHGLAMDDQDRLYALSETQGAVLIFDDPTRGETPNRAVPTGGYKSHLIALTRDGQQAFSMNLLSNTVTYFRPHDPAFVPVVVKPGRKPEGNCLSQDERTLYEIGRAHV